MAEATAGGVYYGGWAPINSVIPVDHGPSNEAPHPSQHFPYQNYQPEEIEQNWETSPIIPWPSNPIMERQQELVNLFPFQLSPRDIALGSIVLSLLATAVLGRYLSMILFCTTDALVVNHNSLRVFTHPLQSTQHFAQLLISPFKKRSNLP